MIVAGINGCQRYKNDVCFISAHDAQTGKELWRTSTIARPGEPGGDTWGDLPLMFRAGGDAWIAGSYDPGDQSDLLGHLAGQAVDAVRPRHRRRRALHQLHARASIRRPARSSGTTSTSPARRTTWTRPSSASSSTLDGRSSVFTMGKLGDPLGARSQDRRVPERRTISAIRTCSTSIARTGKATYRPNMIPKAGVELEFCPSSSGFKSLRAMAYHPDTQAFYIPLNLHCEKRHLQRRRQARRRRRRSRRRAPQEPDAPGKPRRHRRAARDAREDRASALAAPHANAAEHVGADDRRRPGGRRRLGPLSLRARCGRPGKILFQTRLPTSVQGFPITYAVNGKQYLAVPVGTGGGQWVTTIPAELMPEKKIAPGGNAMFVFALPETRR